MKNTKIQNLARSAMIAAMYVALTLVSASLGLSSGAIQVRISEALCVLPVFMPEAIPGVTVGCFIANLLTGGTVWDLTLGVLATLIGAVIARLLRRFPYAASVPTILANTFIIPWVLILSGFFSAETYLLNCLTVGIGEVISCGVFGTVLIWYLLKRKKK
ncbi:MAG: QueT transporter family protein [Ruminococcaceae bacterium]|nr:QueT transporter family protein [Oscillospiraceae bacterium]